MRFRKKPVTIEAVLVADVLDKPGKELPDWVGAAVMSGALRAEGDTLQIGTLEGIMTSERTDWLLRGTAGELYICKPDIFAAVYEPARQDTWQERLVAERQELSERIDKLEAFINSAAFAEVPAAAGAAMQMQFASMIDYQGALDERIELMGAA